MVITEPKVDGERATSPGRTADLLALGGSLHCEDRDNPPPPKNGLNVIAKALLHDESLASDADFSSLSRVAAGCRTEGAWPPAGIGSAGTTFGDAPFFREHGRHPSRRARGPQMD